MHPKIFQEFEKIFATREITGSVLEIGAVPSDGSLLCMKSLRNAREKIGINLDGPFEFKDFRIIKGNANRMNCFEDNSFDAVISNATLEHDKYFWLSIEEIKRVTRPGGLIVIGVPGFRPLGAEKIRDAIKRIRLFRKPRSSSLMHALFTATITFRVHAAPGDYYRFSPQALLEVFFEGMSDVELRSVMVPPIIIGSGIKISGASVRQ
jgi:SAM-dependent methyltransferase